MNPVRHIKDAILKSINRLGYDIKKIRTVEAGFSVHGALARLQHTGVPIETVIDIGASAATALRLTVPCSPCRCETHCPLHTEACIRSITVAETLRVCQEVLGAVNGNTTLKANPISTTH